MYKCPMLVLTCPFNRGSLCTCWNFGTVISFISNNHFTIICRVSSVYVNDLFHLWIKPHYGMSGHVHNILFQLWVLLHSWTLCTCTIYTRLWWTSALKDFLFWISTLAIALCTPHVWYSVTACVLWSSLWHAWACSKLYWVQKHSCTDVLYMYNVYILVFDELLHALLVSNRTLIITLYCV